MGMISEFKQFIAKGNVLDLAVAVVIGAAFGKIVTALVDGIIMPIIGVITGGIDVTDWKYVHKAAEFDATGKELAAEVSVKYGVFIQEIINFLIIAFVIFLVVKAYNRVRKPVEAAPAAPAEDVLLLREIRDELKRRP
ncbi:MAG: large conductance mechanosensitive channel protein MscL [Pseudoxanthomonas suwonensis]|nr:MAG: large conductance mechanosensitive channel protein MscL [Pseudoxanthomonas suwonensis]